MCVVFGLYCCEWAVVTAVCVFGLYSCEWLCGHCCVKNCVWVELVSGVVSCVLCLGCTVVSGLWSLLCVVFGLYCCECCDCFFYRTVLSLCNCLNVTCVRARTRHCV